MDKIIMLGTGNGADVGESYAFHQIGWVTTC